LSTIINMVFPYYTTHFQHCESGLIKEKKSATDKAITIRKSRGQELFKNNAVFPTSSDYLFEVVSNEVKYYVNIERKNCTCRFYNYRGQECKHYFAVLFKIGRLKYFNKKNIETSDNEELSPPDSPRGPMSSIPKARHFQKHKKKGVKKGQKRKKIEKEAENEEKSEENIIKTLETTSVTTSTTSMTSISTYKQNQIILEDSESDDDGNLTFYQSQNVYKEEIRSPLKRSNRGCCCASIIKSDFTRGQICSTQNILAHQCECSEKGLPCTEKCFCWCNKTETEINQLKNGGKSIKKAKKL
jgi:hypothetical protein